MIAEATLKVTLAGSDTDVLHSTLVEGYSAFLAGDIERARSLFARATTTFPDSASAHNNFGFVLLGNREAAAALEEFNQAKALGYQQSELLIANAACCLYLLGRTEEAFDTFSGLLGSRMTSSTAVLYAIGAESLVPIQLASGADYIALMALNAGWSALAADKLADARQFANIASTGRISFEDGVLRSTFTQRLDELATRLEAPNQLRKKEKSDS